MSHPTLGSQGRPGWWLGRGRYSTACCCHFIYYQVRWGWSTSVIFIWEEYCLFTKIKLWNDKNQTKMLYSFVFWIEVRLDRFSKTSWLSSPTQSITVLFRLFFFDRLWLRLLFIKTVLNDYDYKYYSDSTEKIEYIQIPVIIRIHFQIIWKKPIIYLE